MSALFQLSSGVYVVCSAAEGKASGCIANTAIQVTSTPPQIAITLNKKNLTSELIAKSGLFRVGMLAEAATLEFIGLFGFKSGRDLDKFAGCGAVSTWKGIPCPVTFVTGVLSCALKNTVDVGTHLIFIGEVEEDAILSEDPVMTYAFYHHTRKGSTPPNAPRPVAVSTAGKAQWRCTVCGFVYEDDPLPADYICPLCDQDASVFERIIGQP